jgi:hypothetical protein
MMYPMFHSNIECLIFYVPNMTIALCIQQYLFHTQLMLWTAAVTMRGEIATMTSWLKQLAFRENWLRINFFFQVEKKFGYVCERQS